MQIRNLGLALTPLWATLVSGSPIVPAEPAVFQSALDQTFDVANPVNTTNDGGHILQRRRGEIGTAVCRHQYCFFHEEWIMQVPEAWWKEKYHGHADQACRAWHTQLEGRGICGLRLNECWEMDKQYPSGEPGWLHARMTTCIGPNMPAVESTYPVLFDIGNEDHDFYCHHGIRLF